MWTANDPAGIEECHEVCSSGRIFNRIFQFLIQTEKWASRNGPQENIKPRLHAITKCLVGCKFRKCHEHWLQTETKHWQKCYCIFSWKSVVSQDQCVTSKTSYSIQIFALLLVNFYRFINISVWRVDGLRIRAYN